jgi:hypothetical protein
VGFTTFVFSIFGLCCTVLLYGLTFLTLSIIMSFVISLRWCVLLTSTSGGGSGTSTNIKKMDARTSPQPWMP